MQDIAGILPSSPISGCYDDERPTAEDFCRFLAEYAASLFASGATCMRIDNNIGRMARKCGYKPSIFIMPRHIHVNLTDASGRTYSHMCDISDGAVSFLVNTRLSRLSWEFADAQIDFHTLKRSWRTVLKSPAPFPAWVVTILVAVANASFCRLFGGDAPAMAMVFIATYIGFLLKGLLSAKKMDMRLVFVICSFASAIICTGAVASGLTQTPRIAVSTCILYLVPGIPFINSLSDMLAHHYICAFGRFINATVLTCCLSLGLSVGLLMLHYALL